MPTFRRNDETKDSRRVKDLKARSKDLNDRLGWDVEVAKGRSVEAHEAEPLEEPKRRLRLRPRAR